ncbi:hypothetical protein ACGFYQ_11245 [Streptomyces sp. NPDC048258]|uniref:DUF7144 family membrane protein n=1 Tax=Streptomyces sp. NPDC048258 TaxID=3365527 RepID=UPI00371CC8FC
MAQPSTPAAPRGSAPHDSRNAWAAGGAMFAGVLLLVDGVFAIIKGISSIADDEVYTRLGSYVFKFDLTAWGWIHLILGIILVVVGIGVLKVAAWARALGVAFAACSIILNFMWLPYTPFWAIISIVIDIFVIWALCTEPGRSRSATA